MRASRAGFQELLPVLQRRWRIVHFVHRFLLSEFYILLATAALFALLRLLGFETAALLAVPSPTLLFLCYLGFESYRSRKSPTELLWDADLSQGTRHLLPAAFGALDRSDSDPMARALTERAERELPRVRVDLAYPWLIPFQTYLIPLAMVALLMVALFVTRLEPGTEPNPWLGYVEQLREEADSIARAAEEAGDEEGAALAEELSALADMLEKRPEEKETQERVTALLPRLESRMRRLGATDLLTDPRNPRTGGQVEADQTGTLRAGRQEGEALPLLGEENGVPQGGEGTATEEGAAPFGEATDALKQLQERLAQNDANQSTQNPGESRGPSRAPEPGESGNGRTSSTPEGRGEEPGSDAPEEESPREGAGSRPGDEAVADLGEEESSRIDGAVQRLLELPQSEGEADSFTELFAREAPGTPESTVVPEERLAQYRRQVEEAVRRTEVPPELEGVVRDYFLKIGEARYE